MAPPRTINLFSSRLRASPAYTDLPSEPSSEQPPAEAGRKARLRLYVSRLQYLIRALSLGSRVLSTILNVVMFAFMLVILITFVRSRQDIALARNVWPQDPKIWPTILLLMSAALTLSVSIVPLILQCLYPQRMATRWKWAAVNYGMQITAWIIVSILYRSEKALDDLWGWSCSEIAQKLQGDGHADVAFHDLCTVQGASWILSLVETGTKLLFAVCYFLLHRKTDQVNSKIGLTQRLGDGAMAVLDAL
ncbi:MAG: hypothetical protein L6R41_002351 [Letrouitia leprolyta]|nr:MAG: hypothetical protein L6R41_002351 [Letrouitia leprolyta]